MFSKKFLNLMNKYPENRDVFKRLGVLYIEMGRDPRVSLPLLRMLDMLSLTPSSGTFSIIRLLEKKGFIRKVVRVESPSELGLMDFDSISDVPDVIEDFRTGMDLNVKPEHIKILYSISGDIESYDPTSPLV
jgi:hypothetical protein